MNQKEENNRIPQNDPSKAMDSKKEVENSKDPKTDTDFPGYPHYPAKEDIMDQRTGTHRVDADIEDLAGRNNTGVSQRFVADENSRATDRLEERDADEPAPLDVPGSELDDANEIIGEEDEENNYYSLGGDRHDSLEEDPTTGPERAE